MGQRPRKGLDTSSDPARVWLCCLVASGWVLFWKTCEKVGVKGWSQDTGRVDLTASFPGPELCEPWQREQLRDPCEDPELWHHHTSQGEDPRCHLQERALFPPAQSCWYGPGYVSAQWALKDPWLVGEGTPVGLNPSTLLWQVPPLQVLGKGKVSGMHRG